MKKRVVSSGGMWTRGSRFTGHYSTLPAYAWMCSAESEGVDEKERDDGYKIFRGVGAWSSKIEGIYTCVSKNRWANIIHLKALSSSHLYNNTHHITTMFKTTLFALAALAGTSVSASPAPKAAPAGELAKKDSQWGTGTFYYQNGNPGNCGWYMGDGDNICAINNAYYDGGSHCGNWVTIKNTNTGAQTAVCLDFLCFLGVF